jgi:hypothetical protein
MTILFQEHPLKAQPYEETNVDLDIPCACYNMGDWLDIIPHWASEQQACNTNEETGQGRGC